MELNELKNRAKLLVVTAEQVIKMLFWREGDTIVLPVLPEELKGAMVVAVNHDFMRQCFALKLCRPDWPVVPPGSELEWIGFGMEQEVVKLAGSEDDLGAHVDFTKEEWAELKESLQIQNPGQLFGQIRRMSCAYNAAVNPDLGAARRRFARLLLSDPEAVRGYVDNVACELMDRLGVKDKPLVDELALTLLRKILE